MPMIGSIYFNLLTYKEILMFNKILAEEFWNWHSPLAGWQQQRAQVYVVSEETIKDIQSKKKTRTLKEIDDKIESLEAYKQEVIDFYKDADKKIPKIDKDSDKTA